MSTNAPMSLLWNNIIHAEERVFVQVAFNKSGDIDKCQFWKAESMKSDEEKIEELMKRMWQRMMLERLM